jgi:TRAP-type C4-dicarboxylate transport system permease small subunit
VSQTQGADAQAAAQEVVQAGALRGPEIILGIVCCLLMLLIVGLTFVEVFMRYVFARPIKGAEEIIQFAMGTMIFAALPLITARRGHVTVSLIEEAVKGRVKRTIDVVVDLCSLTAVSLIAWRLFIDAMGRVASSDATVVLNWPRAPLVFAMAALAGITALVQAGMLLQRAGLVGTRR